MWSSLKNILGDDWAWRSQIRNLGMFELKKKSRGAALGWLWFFVKPALYIFVFWFALEIGLRSGSSDSSAPPYILWLSAGLIPWFFMQSILNGGTDVFHKHGYLVTKIRFPLGSIPLINIVSNLVIQLGLLLALVVMYFACGQLPDVYLLQVPLIWAVMVFFFYVFSLMASCMCAFSKDVKNLIASLTTPFFWLSGIIFDMSALNVGWVKAIMLFNPITSLTTASRAAFYDKYWIWEKPEVCLGFAAVFAVTLLAALFVYKRTRSEVADVL